MIPGDYNVCNIRGIKRSVINDRYVLGDMLGMGSYGVVYKAYDIQDDRFIALKILFQYGSDQRCKRIVQNVLRIKNEQDNNHGLFCESDAIVRVFDVFRLPASRDFVYAMEYVDVKSMFSMREVLNGIVKLDEKQKCEIAIEIAKVFNSIHYGGYAYKDINEGNVFLSRDGKVMIVDVDNISKNNDSSIGTHGYMAPEVYEGKPSDQYSDRMSLAVFLYRLFMGKNHFPYDGKMSEDFVLNHAGEMNRYELFREIYGRNAVFVFDPKDHRNNIRNKSVPHNIGKELIWKSCVSTWDGFPGVLKNAFIRSFSEGKNLATAGRRLFASQWQDLFAYVKGSAVATCPSCRNLMFICGRERYCPFCGEKIHFSDPLPEEDVDSVLLGIPKKTKIAKKKEVTKVQNDQVLVEKKNEKSVNVEAISIIQGGRFSKKATIRYIEGGKVRGDKLFRDYGNKPFLQLTYSERRNAFAFLNVSDRTWICSSEVDDVKRLCGPDQKHVLQIGSRIEVEGLGYILVVKSINV